MEIGIWLFPLLNHDDKNTLYQCTNMFLTIKCVYMCRKAGL